MDLIYRALGVAAAANNALGRYRLNFIPSNLLIAVVAGFVCVFNIGGWLEAVNNGIEPQEVRLQELTAPPAGGATFVRTAGILVPDAGFQYGEKDDGGDMKRVKMEFVPIIDRDSGRGLFVQLPASHRFGAEPQTVQLTGMLRPMQEFLARELRGSGFEYGGVQMMAGSMLVADETPGDSGSWLTGAAASGAVVGLYLLLTLKRNTIFVRGTAGADGAVDAAGDPRQLRATGTFLLDKHAQRFIEMPAALGTLDNGDLAVLANVDASSNFMGVKYQDRAGIWMLPVESGSLHNVEEGTLYYGTRRSPALRFAYRETMSHAARTAILSVPSLMACRQLLGELSSTGSPGAAAAASK